MERDNGAVVILDREYSQRAARMQPQLKHLKDEFGRDPKQYAGKLQELYAENGLSFTDARSLFGLIAQ